MNAGAMNYRARNSFGELKNKKIFCTGAKLVK